MPNRLMDCAVFRYVRQQLAQDGVFTRERFADEPHRQSPVRPELILENGEHRIFVGDEFGAASRFTDEIGEYALFSLQTLQSKLFVVYFSPLDDICHGYMDLIEDHWPNGRGSLLVKQCIARIDNYVGALMRVAREDSIVVLTADHGQMAYRNMLFVNELFERRGLLRTKNGEFQFSNAVMYYHPSGCGQVVVNPRQMEKARLKRNNLLQILKEVVEDVNRCYNARLTFIPGQGGDPFIAFLVPQGDTYFTGKKHPNGNTVDENIRGGHHLSPLSGSSRMNAVFGLWSPAGTVYSSSMPARSSEVKDFLLKYTQIT